MVDLFVPCMIIYGFLAARVLFGTRAENKNPVRLNKSVRLPGSSVPPDWKCSRPLCRPLSRLLKLRGEVRGRCSAVMRNGGLRLAGSVEWEPPIGRRCGTDASDWPAVRERERPIGRLVRPLPRALP